MRRRRTRRMVVDLLGVRLKMLSMDEDEYYSVDCFVPPFR